VDELLFNLEDERTREQLSTCMKELQQAEQTKNIPRIHELLKKCQEFSERLRIFSLKRGYNQK
jgi:hypothetical protein